MVPIVFAISASVSDPKNTLKASFKRGALSAYTCLCIIFFSLVENSSAEDSISAASRSNSSPASWAFDNIEEKSNFLTTLLISLIFLVILPMACGEISLSGSIATYFSNCFCTERPAPLSKKPAPRREENFFFHSWYFFKASSKERLSSSAAISSNIRGVSFVSDILRYS